MDGLDGHDRLSASDSLHSVSAFKRSFGLSLGGLPGMSVRMLGEMVALQQWSKTCEKHV